MSFKQFVAPAMVGLGAALIAGQVTAVTPAVAQDVSYPWCTEGSALHCYYMNRQQCEETVDYHGFCVTNPGYRAQNDTARRRTPPQ
jgi:hypothetical protein